MPKKKKLFEIKKINKRRKLPELGWLGKFKRFIHTYDNHFRHAALVIATVVGMWAIHNYQEYGGYLFKASVLETPPPFTGTVYPVDKVPDWTNWNGDNHTDLYNSISANLLVALPEYDLSDMNFPNDNLEWGNKSHDRIRNTKITYPVVYLGNYELDHRENAGSHLAVDIKMPVGTPIKTIANGRVVKVSLTPTGFGHHVVVKHSNVPDPDNPGKKTDLFSAYNHMDKIYVSEGETVNKGQVIGTSGNTGTSTTPHLHFQIDRESAPWHPYWPFSWAESQAAGLSFFEAVNAGLGQSKAREHSTHPMRFVALNLDHDGADEVPTPEPEKDPEPTVEPKPEPEVEPEKPVEVLPEPDPGSGVDTSLFSFKVVGETTAMVGNGITITATDQLKQIEQMSDTDTVRVSVDGVGRVSKKSFRKVDFKSGSIKVIVNSEEPGAATVEIGKTLYRVNFIDEIKPIAGLAIEHDGNFQNGHVEVLRFIALDENDDPTPVVNFAGTISVRAKEGEAKFTPDRLAVNDFKNGVAEVRMTANNDGKVVVRAQNGAIIGESGSIYAEPTRVFSDVNKSHPNYDAIKYLEEYNIIGGYSDGTFKPEETVNRVEALKMLMLAFDIEAGPAGELPFHDTDDAAWYATTLATAVNKAIVKGYEDGTFKPGSTVNKAEYLKMLFRTNGIEPTDNLAANPYEDVPKDAWYAPYAYMTNKRNLLDVASGRLEAANGMTRGDVAETIYRMIYLLENNLVSYAK